MQESVSTVLNLLESFLFAHYWLENIKVKYKVQRLVILQWEKSASGKDFLMTSLNPPWWYNITLPPYKHLVACKGYNGEGKGGGGVRGMTRIPVWWFQWCQENPKSEGQEDRNLVLSRFLQGRFCSCWCLASVLSYSAPAQLHWLPYPFHLVIFHKWKNQMKGIETNIHYLWIQERNPIGRFLANDCTASRIQRPVWLWWNGCSFTRQGEGEIPDV